MSGDTDHVAVRFPVEELRELGIEAVAPKRPAPEPGFSDAPGIYRKDAPPKPNLPVAEYATPWRVADYDERVLVLDADGCSLFEVFPGQHHGYRATRADRRAIAELIVDAVNTLFGAGYAPAHVARQMAEARGELFRTGGQREHEGTP